MTEQPIILPGDLADVPPKPSARLAIGSALLVVVGAAACVLAWMDPAQQPRLASAWLWGFLFIWSVVIGCLFFLALHYLTHAIWSVVVKRVADMLVSAAWVLPLLFAPIAMFIAQPGRFHLFPWLEPTAYEPGSFRLEYLNAPFFLARSAGCLAIWLIFAWFFVSRSLRQDALPLDAAVPGLRRLRAVSAPFMLFFAASVTIASIDWAMSLQPHGSSTMFPVYVFAGMTVSGLSAVTLATLWLRRTGRIISTVVRDEHLYSLGGLIFAFVCFWGYIGFSQYMLIWYANLPEESSFVVQRANGGWLGVTVALWIVRFGIPFVVLLGRGAKMNPVVLACVSILMLVGQLLDLYWLILPAYHSAGPMFGWQEAGPVLLMLGVIGLAIARFVSRHRAIAVGDPMLDLSLKFRLH
jgi:hypothetical protein